MLPNKKYNIIYADPPWQYNESWGNGQVGYNTMTNEDICNLPVSGITENKAHLYLWVTNPIISEGLEICESDKIVSIRNLYRNQWFLQRNLILMYRLERP